MTSPNRPTSSTRLLSNRTIRLTVLLGFVAIAATVLASVDSSARSLGQRLVASAAAIIIGAPETRLAPASHSLVSESEEAAPQTQSSTMTTARRGHTATRLSDGRVLIAGGENSSGTLNQSELYDPSSSTFSAAASMGAERADHTATLLGDGRVLIAGGRNGAGALATTELFDPGTGVFTNGPSMSVARAGHSATLFGDGRVFIAGGEAGGSTEILDLVAGTSAGAGNLGVARSMHSAALLQDGRVLIVGGRDVNGNGSDSAEIFDTPASTFWTIGNSFKVSRLRAHLRVLFDGKVQIIGGSDDGSMEVYDPMFERLGAYAHVLPETDTCTGLKPGILASQTRAALFHNAQTDALFDRSGHTITELGGQAVVVGGANSDGTALSSSAVFNSSPASITTDKVDYAPGETAVISGRGFQPGETVRLKIHEDPHTDLERGLDVVADADGNFTGEYLVMEYDLDMKFIVGAKGLTSGWTAQTTFTDATTVTSATGGTNISADKAANATSPAFTTLGDIVIAENVNNDFSVQANRTLILTAPTGWQFNPGVGTTAATKTGAGGNELNDNSITVTATTITVNISVTGITQLNTLSIKGIEVRATDGANVPGSGNILRTVANPGTATIAGIVNGTTNFGSLSQVAGAINKLIVTLPGQTFTDGSTVATSGNSGTPTAQTVGTSFNISKITATDQFFNVVTSYSGAKTISYTGPGTNAGFSSPSYTTAVSFTNGVSTTTLATTLRKAETTTITASDGTTNGPASSNLTVNAGALSSFIVTNTSDGIIGTQTAGTPFDIKVRAIDAGGNTITSFDGGSNKVMISPSSGTLSAGSGNTDAFINGVLSSWSVTFSISGSYPGSFSLTATGIGGNSGITGTSNNFTVNAPPCTTPTVTLQPVNQGVTYGAASATFTAAANGTPSPTVQWQQNTGSGFTNIGGATSTTLTINNPTVAMSGTQYRAVFTNTCGSVNSNAATLTVSPKPVTASVTANNKTYDGNTTATISGCTLSGVLAGDVANVSCSAAGPNTFANANVGTGKAVTATNITLSGSASANYSLSSTSATTTADITTKALTATLTASDKQYDGNATESDASMSCSVSGVLAGDTANVACAATSGSFNSANVTTANQVTATVTISGTAAGNYTLGVAGTATSSTSATATAHITPKTLTASIVGNPTKTYDGNTSAVLTPANFSLSGLAGSESFSINQTAGTYNNANVALATTVTASLSAGDFTPGAGTLATNYTLPTSASGAGQITKANAVVVVTPYSVTYDGQPHTAAVTSITGVNGETGATVGTVDVSNTTHTAAGTYAADYWFFTGTANYNHIGNTTITDQIDKANAVITVTGFSGIYDSSAHGATGSATGVQGEDLSSLLNLGASFSNVPGGTANWTFNSGYANNNYNTASSSVAIVINSKPVTVTTSNNSKTYGDAEPNPLTTADLSGFVATDGITASFSRAPGSNAGNYHITTTLNDPGSKLGNYTVTNNGATFTINARTLTATIIGDPTKPYDGNTDAMLSPGNFSLSTLAAGESITVNKATGTYNSANAGTANLVTTSLVQADFTAGPGTDLNNYSLPTTASGAGHISALTLTYVANAVSRTYGANNPSFTGAVTGFINGDTVASATTGTLTFTSPATNSSNVGSYAINGSGLTGKYGNYAFAQHGNNATALTITPAMLTYVADAKTRQYGANNPLFSGQVTGFVLGQTQATATTGTLAFTTPATITSNVGSYAVNGSGLTAKYGNYNFVQAAANTTALTITQATLYVNAANKTTQYTDLPALTYGLSGFKNGDTDGIASGSPVCILNTPGVNRQAGTYASAINCTPGSLAATNYTFATGTPGSLTITQEDASIEYTGDNIGFTGVNMTLEATVKDSAAAGYVPAGDTTRGDITKMWIKFDIYTAANYPGTPTATVYVQVSDTGTPGDGIGTAQTLYTSNTEGTYCVTATLVAGNNNPAVNAWYQAEPDDATLTFYSNTGKFVTGGGWVVDPTAGSPNRHGNFGFNARTNKNGLPQGQLVYVYRGLYTGPCTIGKTITTCTDVPVTYVIKSNSITALGFLNLGTPQYPWPIQSRMQGKANIQINRSSDGALLWSEGNANFDSTITDSGQSSGVGSDDFKLTVIRNGQSEPYKFVDTIKLSGGNVVIHIQ